MSWTESTEFTKEYVCLFTFGKFWNLLEPFEKGGRIWIWIWNWSWIWVKFELNLNEIERFLKLNWIEMSLIEQIAMFWHNVKRRQSKNTPQSAAARRRHRCEARRLRLRRIAARLLLYPKGSRRSNFQFSWLLCALVVKRSQYYIFPLNWSYCNNKKNVSVTHRYISFEYIIAICARFTSTYRVSQVKMWVFSWSWFLMTTRRYWNLIINSDI